MGECFGRIRAHPQNDALLQPRQHLGSALEVPGITGIRITAQVGQIIAPPPDGASYLGFIFSLCANSAEAEMALRLAHATLLFDIQPEYKVQESISEH